MNEYNIDGDAIARAPLAEIKSARNRMAPGSTLRSSFNDVLRLIAVQLISGDVPEGMTPKEAVRQGRNILALLQSDCESV